MRNKIFCQINMFGMNQKIVTPDNRIYNCTLDDLSHYLINFSNVYSCNDIVIGAESEDYATGLINNLQQFSEKPLNITFINTYKLLMNEEDE